MTTERRRTVSLNDIVTGAVDRASDISQIARAAFSGLLLNKEKRDSIGLLLERQAERYTTYPAVQYADQTFTYREFNAQVNRVANLLRTRGVKSGDVVAVFVENRPEALFAALGAIKLGATASMVNTSQRSGVLQHSIALSHPRAVIVGEELLDAYAEVHDACGGSNYDVWVIAENLGAADYDWEHGECQPHPMLQEPRVFELNATLGAQRINNPPTTQHVTLGTPAFYVFTSGTTGMPKASIMSHLRWMRACYGVGLASLGTKASDVFYCALPLYHNNALTLSLSATLGSGASLAIARKFSASRFWDDVRRFDATMFCYIGEFCRYLLAQPETALDKTHQIRGCMGNGLRPEIWAEFQDRFGIENINEFYASSEGNVAFVNAFRVSQTAGFCPFSFAVVEYDVERDEPKRDKNNFMIRVPRGGVGLLVTEVTEKMSFEGYTDASASSSKLIHNVFTRSDTWFNTGDLVRDQGYKHIQFVDRLGDTFRWKGENVATTEIESVINAWDDIDYSVVYGVEVPGADGRAGMAALVPLVPLEQFDLEGFSSHLRASLPPYAVPRFLRFRHEAEMTATFKHKKVDLKKQGFDPRTTDEPIFVLFNGSSYTRVDASDFDATVQRIRDKSIRL